jgi:hypothetical protein
MLGGYTGGVSIFNELLEDNTALVVVIFAVLGVILLIKFIILPWMNKEDDKEGYLSTGSMLIQHGTANAGADIGQHKYTL